MKTRRTFIKCAVCTAATACVPEPKYNGTVSVYNDTAEAEDAESFCSVSPNGNWSVISLDDHPDLEIVGGFSYVDLNGRRLIIAHVLSDCFVSLDSACTHEGETLQYQSEAQRFFCPRHAATFTPTGEVIGGPAPFDLGYYPTARQGREIWIQA